MGRGIGRGGDGSNEDAGGGADEPTAVELT